jgi:hypothetical protein
MSRLWTRDECLLTVAPLVGYFGRRKRPLLRTARSALRNAEPPLPRRAGPRPLRSLAALCRPCSLPLAALHLAALVVMPCMRQLSSPSFDIALAAFLTALP